MNVIVQKLQKKTDYILVLYTNVQYLKILIQDTYS